MPITGVGKRHFYLSLHSPCRTASRPRKELCFPRTVSMAAVLVPVRLEEVEQQGRLLSYAVTTAKSRVFLYLTGPLATERPTPAALDCLAHCYDPVARLKPIFDVVPLFPSVGWTPERLAELPGVEELVAAVEYVDECNALLDQINAARERLQQPFLSLTLTAGGAAAADSSAAQQPQQQEQQQGEEVAEGDGVEPIPGLHSRVIGEWDGPLQFHKVAVGGTFDRLHAGHRLLLAATALVSTAYIFVGVTAQKLLMNKKNRDLLEPYESRAAAAVDYMRAVNPGVVVIAGPLNDPNVPPTCAIDPEYDAIVVSEETIPGADAINRTRAERGMAPLVIVVVGLIASQRQAVKLSSTDLRMMDAERAALK